MPSGIEPPADPAVLRVEGRQRDARDGRRHGERQIDQGIDELLADERIAHQRPGHDQPEDGVDGGGDQRRAERQLVGSDDARRRNRVPERLRTVCSALDEDG